MDEISFLIFVCCGLSSLFGAVIGYKLCDRNREKRDYLDWVATRESDARKAAEEAKAFAEHKLIFLNTKKAHQCRRF
jgi:hypothetical protein